MIVLPLSLSLTLSFFSSIFAGCVEINECAYCSNNTRDNSITHSIRTFTVSFYYEIQSSIVRWYELIENSNRLSSKFFFRERMKRIEVEVRKNRISKKKSEENWEFVKIKPMFCGYLVKIKVLFTRDCFKIIAIIGTLTAAGFFLGKGKRIG